jgi:hypothetical protein
MTVIAQGNVKDNLNKIFSMYEKHIIEEKIRLYEKKYSTTFEKFEEKVNESNTEKFEEWDDYIEWKAYNQKYFEYFK